MRKMQITFISKGFRDVLFSAGVKEMLTQQANIIKNRAEGLAGSDATFKATIMAGNYGGGRWVAYVQPGNEAAVEAEAYSKALSRAVK